MVLNYTSIKMIKNKIYPEPYHVYLMEYDQIRAFLQSW